MEDLSIWLTKDRYIFIIGLLKYPIKNKSYMVFRYDLFRKIYVNNELSPTSTKVVHESLENVTLIRNPTEMVIRYAHEKNPNMAIGNLRFRQRIEEKINYEQELQQFIK